MDWTELYGVANLYSVSAEGQLITIRAVNLFVMPGWVKFETEMDGKLKPIVMPANRVLEIQPVFTDAPVAEEPIAENKPAKKK